MAQWDDTAIDWYAESFGEVFSNQWLAKAAGIVAGKPCSIFGGRRRLCNHCYKGQALNGKGNAGASKMKKGK